MKKKETKKKFDPSYGTRIEWKDQAENEIITLQEDLDECIEGLDLSEETKQMIERAVGKFKERLYDCIDRLEITPKMIEVQDKGELLSNLFEEIWYERILISESDIDQLTDIVKDQKRSLGGEFVQVDNLAQQMRLEAFIEDLYYNPCQLKLIA